MLGEETKQPYVTIEKLKKDILSLGDRLNGAEAIGIYGSLVQGSFHTHSDLDIFVVVGKLDEEKELYWIRTIRDLLRKYRRDVTVLVYSIKMLKKIITWYVFELASDSVIVYDKGQVKKIFDEILDRAVNEWGLVRKKSGRHFVWQIGRVLEPGEVLKFELDE